MDKILKDQDNDQPKKVKANKKQKSVEDGTSSNELGAVSTNNIQNSSVADDVVVFANRQETTAEKAQTNTENERKPVIAYDVQFDKNEEATHIAQQKRTLKAATELQKAKDKSNRSTKKISVKIKGNRFFFVNLEDMHVPEGDMYALIECIISLAKIPGMLLGIGGDIFNNAIKNSVSACHPEIMSTQEAIECFSTALFARAEEEGINLSEKFLYIRSGNHCNRSVKEVSMDPAWVFAKNIKATHRYVKNIARVEVDSFDLDDKFIGRFIIEAEHGSETPTKPGKQADSTFNAKIDQGADLYVKGHSHQKVTASEMKSFFVPGKTKPIRKEASFWNSGAHIPGGEYADYAGYPFPAMYDGEVAVITINNQTNKQVDFTNIRSLMEKREYELINNLEEGLKKLEKAKFKSRNEMYKSYSNFTVELTKNVLSNVKTDQEAKDVLIKKAGGAAYLVNFSGLKIGEETDEEFFEKLAEHIEIARKLNAYILLDYDILFYKKAITLVNKNGNLLGEKFPDETYAYVKRLAELFHSVSDRIIFWGNGNQEDKISKYQSEALAKMAMSRSQMPESLCYEPYDKTALETEQKKIQSMQVDAYNKQMLAKEVNNAMKNDVEEAIREAAKYFIEDYNELSEEKQEAAIEAVLKKYRDLPIDVEDNKKHKEKSKVDYLKDILSTKLRADGVVLDDTENIDYINYKFPLQEVELRKPHRNLLGNMFCKMVGRDPKKVIMSSDPREVSSFVLKVKDDKGKTRPVTLVCAYMNGGASRDSSERRIKDIQAKAPGADIYIITSPMGKEYMIMDKQTYTNPITGEFVKKDVIYISPGTYNRANPTSVNKIYKIFTEYFSTQKDPLATGIYEDIDDDVRVFCESWHFETVFSNRSIFLDYATNALKRSCIKKGKELDRIEELKRIQEEEMVVEKALSMAKEQKQTKTELKESDDKEKTA